MKDDERKLTVFLQRTLGRLIFTNLPKICLGYVLAKISKKANSGKIALAKNFEKG